MRQILERPRALTWLLVAALLTTAPACRRNGRTPAPETQSGDPVAARTTDATTTPSSDMPAPDNVGPDAAPTADLPPFVPEPEPVVPPELPLRLAPRDGMLRFSASALATGGGGSVVVATGSGSHAGCVFERLAAGWVETFRFDLAVLGGHPGGREQLAVSDDGDTIAVALLEADMCTGGPCPTRGHVGFWERRPDGWARTPNLAVSDELAFKGLGLALALAPSGDLLVLSTRDEPAAYVFERTATGWSPPARLVAEAPPGFGAALALDGDRLAVGAPGREDPETGAVVLFERRAGAWAEADRIVAPRGADRTFGSTVALAGDLLVAGGYGTDTERGGAAFVFERGDAGWRPTARLMPLDDAEHKMYGRTATILGGGRLVAVQSLYAAHFFTRDDDDWRAVETLGGRPPQAEVRALAAAGPAAAVLGTSDVLLRTVPGLDLTDLPPVPVRPAPTPPDCRRSRACLRPCAADADCCPEPPCGEELWSGVCRDAVCRLRGCTTDEECAPIPDSRCFPDPTGTAVHGLCAPPCTTDADCRPPYRCVAGEHCALGPDNPHRCFSDLDCARRNGIEHCDVASGCCECTDGNYCERPTLGGPGLRCLPR